ncbi:MAG: archaeal heat shock protein Hsp20 [Candidatus Thorarchaeota archaeon]
MSWDDDSFDPNEDPRKMLRKWLGDFLPESMFHQIEEMMDQMMKQLGDGAVLDPTKMQEFMKNPEGTNPFVFGFSMKVGPDGKPMMQRFGNTPGEDEKMTSHLEPLVDVIDDNDDIIIIAEVPGIEKDEIKVRIKGTKLTIHVDNSERPYHKDIELPTQVKKDHAKSSLRNGVLEVRLKKA